MSIEFTQFLLPDGRQKKIKIDRPKAIEDLATELDDAGHRFEIEVLMNGVISMTVEIEGPDGEEITRAHELVENGPKVPKRIDKLIQDAYTDWGGRDELADRYGPAMREGAED